VLFVANGLPSVQIRSSRRQPAELQTKCMPDDKHNPHRRGGCILRSNTQVSEAWCVPAELKRRTWRQSWKWLLCGSFLAVRSSTWIWGLKLTSIIHVSRAKFRMFDDCRLCCMLSIAEKEKSAKLHRAGVFVSVFFSSGERHPPPHGTPLHASCALLACTPPRSSAVKLPPVLSSGVGAWLAAVEKAYLGGRSARHGSGRGGGVRAGIRAQSG